MDDQLAVEGSQMKGGWIPLMALTRSNFPRLLLVVALAFLVGEAGARIAERTAESPPLRWYDEAAQIRVEMVEGRSADVVFAGTSMAQQAFVPSVFDESFDGTSFNVGLPGAVPTVTGPWLTDVTLGRLDPTTVVWGLSSLDLSTSYGEAPLAAWQSAPETRTDLLGRVDAVLSEPSALIRMRSLLRRPDELWGSGAAQRARAFERKRDLTGVDGERLGFDAERTAEGEIINRRRLERFAIDPDDVKAIEETITSLRAAGVRVVLVELPVAPAFVELHPRGSVDHDLVSAVIQDLAARLGVDHLALDSTWTDDDFADFTHLTEDDAAAFTRSVASRLTGTEPGDLVPQPNGALSAAESERAAIAATDQEDCEPEVVLDEYGFEIEVTTCADTGAITPLLRFPNDDVESAFELLLLRARASAANCASAATWRASMDSAIETLAQLTMAVAMLEPAHEWIGSDDGDRLIDTASLELLGQPGCSELPHASHAETLAVISRAVSDLNRLSITVEGSGHRGGPLWFSTDQAGHLNEVRRLVGAGEPIDVLAIGSSTVKRGIDSGQLGDAIDARVFNAGVRSLFPDVAGPWLATMLDLDLDPSTVIIGFTSYAPLTPCTPARRNEMVRSQVLQRAMDRLGIDVRAIPILGDDPLLVAYASQFESRGTTRSATGTNQEAVDEDAERFRQRLQSEVCDQQMDSFADLVSAVRRAIPDSRIVVLDMPLHPEMIAAHPGGRDPFDEASARGRQIAAGVEAEYLDARDLLPADEFMDLFHANSLGRSRLTEHLVDALNG